MFSSRLTWHAQPNSVDGALRRMRESGVNYLDLTLSNPTLAGLDYPVQAITSSFNHAGMLSYEPDPTGLETAREQIARLSNVPLRRVILSASTSESYSWLFKLLCNPGDEILTPAPSYPLFEYLAALENVEVRRYPLHYDHGWFVDTGALEARITSRTKAIIIVNPNNPTGSFLKHRELNELVRICREHSLALISDEVFASYTLDTAEETVRTLASVDDVLTFCLNGLSKYAGLPQMKLGWIIAGGPGEVLASALERLSLIADSYLSVGTPVQLALPGLLAAAESIQPQILKRVNQNLSTLRDVIDRQVPAASLLKVEGGWSAIIRVPTVLTEEEWVLTLLQEHKVLAQPGYFYDMESEAYLVLSLLTAPPTFREGVARIAAAVNARSESHSREAS